METQVKHGLMQWLAAIVGSLRARAWLWYLLLVLLTVAPSLLFLLLALGIGWWPRTISLGLAWVTVTLAVAGGLFYLSLSISFFVMFVRGRLRQPPVKRAFMSLGYLLRPFLYGLCAAWGVAVLEGRTAPTIRTAGLVLWGVNAVLCVAEGFLVKDGSRSV